MSLPLLGACLRREQAPRWTDTVDSMYLGWSGLIQPAVGGSLLAWVPLTSDGTGALQLRADDGSIQSLGVMHRSVVAVSPSKLRFAVGNPALGHGPGIDVVEAQTGERVRVADGLIDDRQWQNLLFVNENEIVWTTAVEPDDNGNLVHHVVRSNIVTRESERLATFSDVDYMDLSPDGSRLALAATRSDGEPYGLWLLDLETDGLREVPTHGVDVQYIDWAADGDRFLEAKDRPQRRPAGAGRTDADDFLDKRDLRPGKIYKWSDGGIVPIDIGLGSYVPGAFSLSPDGSLLAVAGWREKGGQGVSGLWLIDIATSAARMITVGEDSSGDGDPALYSPDGRFVAYPRGRHVEVADLATEQRTRLNPPGTWSSLSATWEGAWEADNSLLFFSNMGDGTGDRSRPGRLKLWRWRASDGSFTALATRPDQPPES